MMLPSVRTCILNKSCVELNLYLSLSVVEFHTIFTSGIQENIVRYFSNYKSYGIFKKISEVVNTNS